VYEECWLILRGEEASLPLDYVCRVQCGVGTVLRLSPLAIAIRRERPRCRPLQLCAVAGALLAQVHDRGCWLRGQSPPGPFAPPSRRGERRSRRYGNVDQT
jgi:hypothetical protein